MAMIKEIPVLNVGDIVTEDWINEIRKEEGKSEVYFEVLSTWFDEEDGELQGYSCRKGFGMAYDCRIIRKCLTEIP